MNAVLPRRVIHMTDFKKNPARAVRDAQLQPVVVLAHKRVEMFVLAPALYEALVERVPSDQIEELARRVNAGEALALCHERNGAAGAMPDGGNGLTP